MKEQALRSMERRAKILSTLIILIFLVLLSRLWYLQIIRGEESYALSRQNQTRQIRISAPRGNFYDRSGRTIVTSRMSHVVSVMPEDIKKDPQAMALLGRLLDLSVEEIEKKLEEKSGSVKDQYIPIKYDVDPSTVGKILEANLDLPGVVVEKYPVRNYPLGEWASHLIGYIGEINEKELEELRHLGYRLGDQVGKMGLEKTYETYLRGTDGIRIVEVNRVSEPLKVLEESRYLPGNNLYLTIDYQLQNEAERILREQMLWLQKNTDYKNARSGAVIAINPQNGEILAMVSYPEFDPNLFVGSISGQEMQKLLTNPLHPFTNRVTRGGFMPASTFKPVTVIAALEEEAVDLNQEFYCSGITKIGNATFRCDKREGHGRQTLVEGLQNSCNLVMAELGRKIGPEKLAKYARMFGIGSTTGLNLNPEEITGLIGDPNWKRKTRNQIWFPMETLHLSVGQGYILATPIQLAQIYSAIANGGKFYRPRLVTQIRSVTGKKIKEFPPEVIKTVDLKPSTLGLVREGLQRVVTQGSARYAFAGFPLNKIPVAGKTGTAQNQGKDNFAFFASYAPADHPELVIVVVMEEGGYGSVASAPIARKLFEAYFNLQSSSGTKGQQDKAGAAEAGSELPPVASLPASTQEIKELMKMQEILREEARAPEKESTTHFHKQDLT
ncbi:MAG TPA: penicillin-binding protein 2 [Firmicutes bacterium]|nr:penicillin-binding protein 2 [Bacillota bacterium]